MFIPFIWVVHKVENRTISEVHIDNVYPVQLGTQEKKETVLQTSPASTHI